MELSKHSTSAEALPPAQELAVWLRALRSFDFLRRFWLFEEMNRGLVAVVRDTIRRFLQTHPAQGAARVYVPRTRRILWLFTELIRHSSNQLLCDPT